MTDNGSGQRVRAMQVDPHDGKWLKTAGVDDAGPTLRTMAKDSECERCRYTRTKDSGCRQSTAFLPARLWCTAAQSRAITNSFILSGIG